MTRYPFLSDEWIEAAEALRHRYRDRLPPPPVATTLNVVVTDIPHRNGGDLHGHIDSSDGQLLIEQGHLDSADLVVTVDYATAKAAFVTRDQQVVMQAFMAGKIFVDGDVSKLLTLPILQQAGDPLAADILAEIQQFTSDD